MRIESFQPARLIEQGEFSNTTAATRAFNPGPVAPAAAGAAAEPAAPFGQVLGRELQRVNDALATADQHAQQVATGQAKDLHEAMLAMAEADLALQVTMRVTQKAIAAYQEISRMQI